MRFRPSTLNIFSILFVLGCIIYTIINYKVLSEGEGWGVVGMIGLIIIAIIFYIADIAIHNIVKNRLAANVIGLVIAGTFTILLILEDP